MSARASRFLVPLLAASCSSMGCYDLGTSDSLAPSEGSLRVAATTVGDMPDPDGYVATVDGSTPTALPVNGSVLLDGVAFGMHHVALTGLSSHCLATDGDSATVEVDDNTVPQVSFYVVCEGIIVQPLSPTDGAVIPQNASAPACGGHPGLYLDFDWSDAVHPSGVAGYEILVQHVGSAYPIISTLTVDSRYSVVRCGYVADPNLTDWHWRVRARASTGEWGEWSAYRRFDFAPCRNADGGMCTNG